MVSFPDLCLFSYYEPESDWPAQNNKGNKLSLAHQIRICEIYPRIENLILSMLSYPGCLVRVTYIGCIGSHAHGRQVRSLLC